MNQEKIRKYLERIGFQGTARADRETLFQLHEAHFKTVPYENLDIFLYGKVADLDAESVYEKIVNNHRGGYCFELNGLLSTTCSPSLPSFIASDKSSIEIVLLRKSFAKEK